MPPIRLPLEPRGLQRELAARYVGLSPSKFDQLVASGRMPRPRQIDRRRIWDRHALDEAFEALPSDDDANPWDQMLFRGEG